ncbi:hypothetical protein B6S12_10260 [Helicobacter valdiviensis]|uniref:Uncharacterized protein n=1 Tax=Helicobacter valdiviensis TaxID=1458358 RepID=A0A2W6NIN3_9HELI|nr:hypothetical protein [Helicobacter valdiviensis]PZT47216.1 hypothetical protein B6S12_10260 [Helicobacter valdiviensis]
MDKTLIFHENSHIDLNASFAPGTYVELQLEKESDKTLKWSYIECNSEQKKQDLLDSNYPIMNNELKLIDGFKGDICGFHLPINRDNEPIEDTKDYKYYIIVFAYDEKKVMPSLEDFHIVIDMSFRVGVGKDESVEESKLSSGLKSDTDFIEEWKKLNLIADFYEAYNFILIMIFIYKNDWDNFMANPMSYPQLAGKIAYIYYRFDFRKIYHQIKLKDDMQMKYKNYFQDLKYYEETIKMVVKKHNYKSTQTYPVQWWERLIKEVCNEFKINTKIEFIPMKDYEYGLYDNLSYAININVNKIGSTQEILKTIVHEIRHAYMHQKELKNDALQRYMYFTYKKVYFNAEQIYLDKNKTKDVYYFQPSEAEARAIENNIIKEIQ